MTTVDTTLHRSSEPSLFDEMLVLLASKYRRRILVNLYGESPHDEDERAFTAEIGRAEQVVRAQLQHLHLPKLDEADLVEWGPESDDTFLRLSRDSISRYAVYREG